MMNMFILIFDFFYNKNIFKKKIMYFFIKNEKKKKGFICASMRDKGPKQKNKKDKDQSVTNK